jgi:hypothetical protein
VLKCLKLFILGGFALKSFTLRRVLPQAPGSNPGRGASVGSAPAVATLSH